MEKHSLTLKLPVTVMMCNAIVTAIRFIALSVRGVGDSELIKAFAIADTVSAVLPMLVGGALM